MNVGYGSSSRAYYFENGQRVFPCHCGETHRGDYALYDYVHHNCQRPEWMFLDDDLPAVLMCVHCGQTSELVKPMRQRGIQ